MASFNCSSRFPKFLPLLLTRPMTDSSSSLEFWEESGGEKTAPLGIRESPLSTGGGDW